MLCRNIAQWKCLCRANWLPYNVRCVYQRRQCLDVRCLYIGVCVCVCVCVWLVTPLWTQSWQRSLRRLSFTTSLRRQFAVLYDTTICLSVCLSGWLQVARIVRIFCSCWRPKGFPTQRLFKFIDTWTCIYLYVCIVSCNLSAYKFLCAK